MKKTLKLILALLIIPLSAFAQSGSLHVEGVVVDEAGLPVIGAAVMVKSTQIGTVTDETGKFSFDNLSAQAELQASALGYATATFKVTGGGQRNNHP